MRFILCLCVAVAAGVTATGCKGGNRARLDGGHATAATPPDAGPDLRPEVVMLESMAVEPAAWPAEAGDPLDDHALAGRIWESFVSSPGFAARGRRPLPDAGPGVHVRRARLKAQYGVQVVDAKTMRAGVNMTVEWIDDAEEQDLWASTGCEGSGPAGALVECAIERAAQSLVAKEDVRRGEPKAVIAALDSEDPSLRQVALATIAARRLRTAVPRLLELLHSPDDAVRDGAIGALVALREPRAVKALTELTHTDDLDMMRRIVDAVGEIGGEDARDYLDVLASGHDSALIRDLAEKALRRLDRRAGLPDPPDAHTP